MKTIIFLFFVTFTSFTTAQIKQTHIPASKSIIGIWRQTTWVENGKTYKTPTGNYTVINADSTYFTFVTWPEKTSIGHYGTFEITSDSTIVGHTIMHSMNPDLNGKDQFSKFELIDENTLNLSWTLDNKNWIKEEWTRLPLSR